MKFVFIYELTGEVSTAKDCKSVDEANRVFRLRFCKMKHGEFIQAYGNWKVYLEADDNLIFQCRVNDFWKEVTYRV